ncbi:MAG: hypothetical protein Q6353_005805 [Candidatus Sigynarchaeum springense]
MGSPWVLEIAAAGHKHGCMGGYRGRVPSGTAIEIGFFWASIAV